MNYPAAMLGPLPDRRVPSLQFLHDGLNGSSLSEMFASCPRIPIFKCSPALISSTVENYGTP